LDCGGKAERRHRFCPRRSRSRWPRLALRALPKRWRRPAVAGLCHRSPKPSRPGSRVGARAAAANSARSFWLGKDWDLPRLQNVFRGSVAPAPAKPPLSERGFPLSLHVSRGSVKHAGLARYSRGRPPERLDGQGLTASVADSHSPVVPLDAPPAGGPLTTARFLWRSSSVPCMVLFVMKCAILALTAAAALLLGGCASNQTTWPPPEQTMEQPGQPRIVPKPTEGYAGHNQLMPLHTGPYRTWYPRGADPYY